MAWLTEKQARDQADLFRHHIEKYGVPVRLNLLRRGAGSSGYWGQNTFRANMAHHIASYRSSGLTPGLAVVLNGRTGLPGPLANGYGGFDMVARLITMGLANHPGAGGPYTLDGATIPKDQGRYYFFGWEFEGGYRESDWPADFREFMAICNRGAIDAIRELRGGGVTYDAHLEHKDWAPSRKVDRLGYTRTKALAEIKAAASSGGGTTTGTNFLEKLMAQIKTENGAAVVFFTHNGSIYRADLLAGTYQRIDTPAEWELHKTVLNRSGIPWGNWKNEDPPAAADPAAFGVEVGA